MAITHQPLLLRCGTHHPAPVPPAWPAVRDTRRAEHPGGTKVLARSKVDTAAPDEALEVRTCSRCLALFLYVYHCFFCDLRYYSLLLSVLLKPRLQAAPNFVAQQLHATLSSPG